MTFRLRPRLDEGHPSEKAYWVMSGEATVGVVHQSVVGAGAFWLWSITGFYVSPGKELGPGHSSGETLQDAMQQFATRWRIWLDYAGLQETLRQPETGLPLSD